MPPMEKDEALAYFEALMHGLARHTAKPGHGKPFWGVLSDLCGIGSTSAAHLVEAFGFDPDLQVIEPVWVDFSRQAVVDICPKCYSPMEDCECSEKS